MKLVNCRMCHGDDLHLYLDLGFTPLADRFLNETQLDQEEVYYPLKVVVCENCGLSQLNYVVPPEKMYDLGYVYESSTTKTGRDHFHGMAKSIFEKFNIKKGSLAVDLGSNVGVLLQGFKDCGMEVMGIDPSPGVVATAIKNGIDTITAFFGEDAVDHVLEKKGKATVVTGTNVFAHIHDLDAFMIALERLSDEKGILVIEAPYFYHLLEKLEYDTIYHEHLSYLSVHTMAQFFERFGWELFDVEEVSIHGGSLRYFVSRKGNYPKTDNIKKHLDLEQKEKIHSVERLEKFAESVKQHRKDLRALLLKLKADGKRIIALSVPAKGNTLLHYCNINGDILDYATEKAALKVGKYTPGFHLPVKPDETLLSDKPDYALLLAWNFATEIIKNNTEFTKNGGKFIIPVPIPKVV